MRPVVCTEGCGSVEEREEPAVWGGGVGKVRGEFTKVRVKARGPLVWPEAVREAAARQKVGVQGRIVVGASFLPGLISDR